MERWVVPGTWTRERIIAALRDWFELTGSRPRIYNWSPTEARHLGLYGALCQLWEREHPRWPSANTVAREFGSWVGALRAAGLPAPPSRRAEGTLGERVEDARRLAREGLLQKEIAALIGVSRSTVSSYLAAASCRCGEPVIRPRGPVPRCRRCANATSRERGFDRDSIVAAYHAWRDETGHSPAREDWAPESARSGKWHAEYPRWPSAGEACTQFGRWNALVRAAGERPAQRSWSREEVSAALVALSGELRRTPRQSDLKRHPNMPSRHSVARHFGNL
jgi:hypothetical protein